MHVVKQRQFDVVEQMLKCVWLRPLRYVVVMWCWDFCETPEDAQRLVSCGVSTCSKTCRHNVHIYTAAQKCEQISENIDLGCGWNMCILTEIA